MMISVWKLLIATTIFLLGLSGNRSFGVSGNKTFGEKKCPKGWLQFEGNCYLRQPDLLSFEDAVKSCERKEAKIFESADTFEFEAVRKLFPDYYFTWVKAEVEEELEWLYEPYEEKINGKNTVSTCIAYYASPVRSYNYYYPCSSRFHSICEKSLDSVHQWVN